MGDAGELHLGRFHGPHFDGIPGRPSLVEAPNEALRLTAEGVGTTLQRGVPSSDAGSTSHHVQSGHPPRLSSRTKTASVTVSHVAQSC